MLVLPIVGPFEEQNTSQNHKVAVKSREQMDDGSQWLILPATMISPKKKELTVTFSVHVREGGSQNIKLIWQ